MSARRSARAGVALAAVWAAVAACSASPPAGPIRDVRPTRVERDVTLLIEGTGFSPGAPTTVVFDGTFRRPGATGARAAERARFTAPAEAVGATRVLVRGDAALETRLGRADFSGTVTVVQQVARGEGAATATFASSARAPYELQFFPATLRKQAWSATQWVRERRLLPWLGMQVAPVAGGLRVTAVTERFAPATFLREHDRPPMDGRITQAELGAEWARFSWLDEDRDRVIDKFEAEHAEREDGFAAQAGLRVGDVIAKVNGRETVAIADFLAAWKDDVATVQVEARRGGAAIAATLPRHGLGPGIPDFLIAAGFPLLAALLLIAVLGPFGGLIVVAERRISAQMQSRIGPNRVGPQGLLQWLADGVKLITKEDIVPTDADPYLFRLSPYLVWIGIFGTFVVLPFSQSLIVADMNIGLLYLLSITALVVVGIIMGGWASNSKWSLLGGMRSAAQIISYEIPASLALLSVVALAGTLSPQGIVRAQGGWPWEWNLFANPFTFAAFFIYFISALAEGNRTPFDLPEAESELVSGYNTEYSGFRFSVFFLGEWVNLYVIGAVATAMFLGGWQVPGVTPQMMEANARPPLWAIALCGALAAALPLSYWYLSRRYRLGAAVVAGAVFFAAGAGIAAIGYQALGFAAFFGKALALIFVIIWIRWTLPRFRVDQMMNMCWKYFVPLALAGFLGVTAWTWLVPAPARTGASILLFLVFGVGTLAWFTVRVLKHIRVARTRLWDPFAVR